MPVKLAAVVIALLVAITAPIACGSTKKSCPEGITKPLAGIVRGKAQVSSSCFTVKIQDDTSGLIETVRVSRWTHSHVVIGQRAWLKPEKL